MGLDGMWEELRSYPVWRSRILADPAANGLKIGRFFLMLQRGYLKGHRHFLKYDPAPPKGTDNMHLQYVTLLYMLAGRL